MRPRSLVGAAMVAVALGAAAACAPVGRGGWEVVASPTTTGPSALTSVSCVTATWCLSTGSMGGDDDARASVQRFDGAAWVPGPDLPAAIADAEILSVTCDAVDRCVAVGRRAGAPFLARLVGAAWTDESAGLERPGRYAELTDVWCGDGTCIAVGPGWESLGVALTSAGGAWTELPGPPLYNALSSPGRYALQIDCASPQSCGAVAMTATNVIISTTSYWDGTAWTDPEVTGERFPDVGLFGLDCPAIGRCYASGMAAGAEGGQAGVIATFDGGGWSVGDRMGPGLGSLSCASTDRCLAVAYGNEEPSRLDGAVRAGDRWTPIGQPTPVLPEGGRTGDVSCVPGGDRCLAVGSSPAWSPATPFAYRWTF